MRGDNSIMIQVLTFNVADDWYALDIAEIETIEMERQITRVPGAPAAIQGIADWQGKLVAVVDLRALFGLAPASANQHGFLVVAKEKWYGAALLVDAVDEIVELNPTMIEPPLATLTHAGASCLSGEVKFADRLVGILNLEAVVEAATGGNG